MAVEPYTSSDLYKYLTKGQLEEATVKLWGTWHDAANSYAMEVRDGHTALAAMWADIRDASRQEYDSAVAQVRERFGLTWLDGVGYI